MTQTPDIREMVLAEREKGNVVFWALPGQLATMRLEDILDQPVDGLLYDLNRSEEVVLTFIDDQKWVNDFAVAQVIRKLVEQLSAARAELELVRSLPRAMGVGRDAQMAKAMCVYFERPLTDDEMRTLHDFLAKRPALQPEQGNDQSITNMERGFGAALKMTEEAVGERSNKGKP